MLKGKLNSLLLTCSDPLLETHSSIKGFMAGIASVFSFSILQVVFHPQNQQIHCRRHVRSRETP